MNAKQTISEILSLADVKINGERPWDMKVRDERLFGRVLSGGSLALGEAYMDGWWDVERLDEFFNRVLAADLDRRIGKSPRLIAEVVLSALFNLQSRTRAFNIGKRHYDIGNKLYRLMLDKRLVYSCGYWENATNLDEAQEAKLDLICRKLQLKKGERLLDIGCGWGSLLKFAVERYGVKGVGLTVSKEQVKLARENCKGLPVEIKLQDYRAERGKYDKIVSVGMIEHVGYKNYRAYMQAVHRCLKDDGLTMIHTIGGLRSVRAVDSWIDKYIFPGGMLPSIKQLSRAMEGLFVLEDLHNFGADYDKTLMAWAENFENAWDKLKTDYDERFHRMWRYYLLVCAGSFRARKNQLWQIVMSKNGVPGGYESAR